MLLVALAYACACACSGARQAARPHASGSEAVVVLEILPLRLGAAAIELLVPQGGPPTWTIPYEPATHPHRVVNAALRRAGLAPLVVHSTSWRIDAGALVLTYAAVVGQGASAPGRLAAVPASPARLARGGATTPPVAIAREAVVTHALQHLSWLLIDDAAVRAPLGAPWAEALRPFRPSPFQGLGEDR